jgi:mono/diheme cytochrome c family protein
MSLLLNRTILVVALCYAGLAIVVDARPGVATQTNTPDAKAASAGNPLPATTQSVAAGSALFRKYCRFCHGDDAKGNGPQAPEGTHPPDLTDDHWDHAAIDAEVFAVIKNGIGPKFDMKGFNSKLTAQDMWNIVNYLRSIGPRQP